MTLRKLLGRALQNDNLVKEIFVKDDEGQMHKVTLGTDGKTIVADELVDDPKGSDGASDPGRQSPSVKPPPPTIKPSTAPDPFGSMPVQGTPLPSALVPPEVQRILEQIERMRNLSGGGMYDDGREERENPDVSGYPLPPEENRTDPVFKARLMSVMTDNRYDRKLKGRKRGSLDMHRLYKGQVGATNIFTQKKERKGKEYNIMLLVDESGSMVGQALDEAANLVEYLAQNVENPHLNIKLGVMGFQSFYVHHKRLDEKVESYQKLKMQIYKSSGGGTNDYPALKAAYKELKGRKGTNIVIMVSDGGGHSHTEMHKLVHSNEDIATTIGVGIGYEPRQIPTYVTANSLSELKPLIISTLKSKIRRGL